jgi:predicted phosphodiesterase
VELGPVSVLMVHDVKTLRPGATRGAQVVISGHSHRPLKEVRDGVLYFNPGSAGPRRFTLPVSVGRLDVTGDRVRATLVDLARARDARRAIIAP